MSTNWSASSVTKTTSMKLQSLVIPVPGHHSTPTASVSDNPTSHFLFAITAIRKVPSKTIAGYCIPNRNRSYNIAIMVQSGSAHMLAPILQNQETEIFEFPPKAAVVSLLGTARFLLLCIPGMVVIGCLGVFCTTSFTSRPYGVFRPWPILSVYLVLAFLLLLLYGAQQKGEVLNIRVASGK